MPSQSPMKMVLTTTAIVFVLMALGVARVQAQNAPDMSAQPQQMQGPPPEAGEAAAKANAAVQAEAQARAQAPALEKSCRETYSPKDKTATYTITSAGTPGTLGGGDESYLSVGDTIVVANDKATVTAKNINRGKSVESSINFEKESGWRLLVPFLSFSDVSGPSGAPNGTMSYIISFPTNLCGAEAGLSEVTDINVRVSAPGGTFEGSGGRPQMSIKATVSKN